mgnify:CR=1 FL=1
MREFSTDIPRIYTAIAEVVSCMVMCCSVKNRIGIRKILTGSLIFFLTQSAFLVLTKNVPIRLWLVCMLAAVGMMFFYIRWRIAGSWRDVFYLGMEAFVAAEFIAAFEWQIYLFFSWRFQAEWFRYVGFIAIYGIYFLIIYRLSCKANPENGILNVSQREVTLVLATGCLAFFISNISFLPVLTPFTLFDDMAIGILRMLIELTGLVMLYLYNIEKQELKTKYERDMFKDLLNKQYMQYEQSKESIALVNMKYHDLKHQIYAIRLQIGDSGKREILDQLEEEIHQYETQNRTGNQIVDTILTSKSIICEREGIEMNSVVDGSLLSFMEVPDICSIFGNALDNAIECEKKIPEKEKRLIRVAVFAQNSLLLMRFENYFEDELKLENGLPLTTKKDKENHGYGIKSIQHIAEKYDGICGFDKKSNWFELNILIPIIQNPEKSN